VFGGLVFLSTEDKNIFERKYLKAERDIRKKRKNDLPELKACMLANTAKGKLFRSLNQCIKFGVIIDQQKIFDKIFLHKKAKQRYLDYAYKIAVKNVMKLLIDKQVINPNEKHNMYFFVDEHSTATNGRYELQQNLEEEFKFGTYNFEYNKYYEPIFPNLQILTVKFCDSKYKPLIRAADIIANRIYHIANHNNTELKNNLFIKRLP
jgi:hypothetical protein